MKQVLAMTLNSLLALRSFNAQISQRLKKVQGPIKQRA